VPFFDGLADYFRGCFWYNFKCRNGKPENRLRHSLLHSFPHVVSTKRMTKAFLRHKRKAEILDLNGLNTGSKRRSRQYCGSFFVAKRKGILIQGCLREPDGTGFCLLFMAYDDDRHRGVDDGS
jgi:hypothetical protein